MKMNINKLVLNFIIIFCLFGLIYSSLAVDWTKLTPNPCNGDTTSWSGPYSTKICGYEIYGWSCNPNCCFTIIYYDRWTGNNDREYEINVVGIFWDESPGNCDTCATFVTLFSWAYESILVEKSTNDPTFKNKIVGNGLQPTSGWDAAMYVYNTGNCRNQDSVLCDDRIRCCKHFADITFSDIPGQTNIVDGFQSAWFERFEDTIPCPQGCDTVCFDVRTGPISDTLCPDFDCNYGPWQSKISIPTSITICPGCSVIVYYRTRETEKCTPVYTDIQVDSVRKVGNCINCPPNITVGYLYWYGVHVALRKVGQEKLVNESCDTNFRVISQSCWGPDSLGVTIYPCFVPGCCLGKYVVCKDKKGVVTDSLIAVITDQDSTCSNYITPMPCTYICDEIMTPIELPPYAKSHELFGEMSVSLDRKSYVYPNPASGRIEIHILSPSNSQLEARIYHSNGNRLFPVIKKRIDQETIFEIDLNAQANGTYFYRIFDGSNILSQGSFIIIH
jgi:hypothetical protein